MNRRFLAMLGGQAVSSLGSALLSFGLAVYIFEATESAAIYGLFMASTMVAGIVAAPATSGLVDRSNRRRVVMAFDTMAAVASALMFAAVVYAPHAFWLLVLLAAVGSFGSGAQFNALSALVPSLVDREHYQRIAGLRTTIAAAVELVAPLMGAMLFVAVALDGLILIDAVSFAAALGTMLLIAEPPRAAGQARALSIVGNFKAGWAFIRGQRLLQNLMRHQTVSTFFTGSGALLAVPIVLTHGGELELGIVLSVGSVGGIVGGLLMTVWTVKRRHRVYIGLEAMRGVALLVFGLSGGAVGFATAVFTFYFGTAAMIALNMAVWQERTPEDIRGRVFAVQSTVVSIAMPISYATVGFAVDALLVPALGRDEAYPMAVAGFGALLCLVAAGVAASGILRGFDEVVT